MSPIRNLVEIIIIIFFMKYEWIHGYIATSMSDVSGLNLAKTVQSDHQISMCKK